MKDMSSRRKGIPGKGQKEKCMACQGGEGAQRDWRREHKARMGLRGPGPIGSRTWT